MSWSSDNRNPHEAYVLYEPEIEAYIHFVTSTSFQTSKYVCYATMFPTEMQAQHKIDISEIKKMYPNLVVKKLVLG